MPTTEADGPGAPDLTGGCLCGAVRYRLASKPFGAAWCHCRMCQRSSGSPAMAFAKVPSADYVVESGSDRIRRYASSENAERWFCGRCGTSLLVRDFDGTTYDFSLATLDTPETVTPEAHFHYASHIAWAPAADDLPRDGDSGPQSRPASSGSSLPPSALHDSVHALLREVTAKIILPRYQKLAAHEVTAKLADDVVTVADHESEAMLAEGLAKIVDMPIVGEEAAFDDEAVLGRLSSGCWIVDPLDGTRNFAAGRPPFGILVAMAWGGEAHTGWIYDCLTDRFCVAERGKGAFINGERIIARPTGEASPVAAISLIFVREARREVIRQAIADFRQVDIPWCAAEQYPRLALGQNDVAYFERTLPWDHAAGALWLNEAGGKCARPDGSPYRVDEWQRKGLICAASPALWERTVNKLAGLPD